MKIKNVDKYLLQEIKLKKGQKLNNPLYCSTAVTDDTFKYFSLLLIPSIIFLLLSIVASIVAMFYFSSISEEPEVFPKRTYSDFLAMEAEYEISQIDPADPESEKIKSKIIRNALGNFIERDEKLNASMEDSKLGLLTSIVTNVALLALIIFESWKGTIEAKNNRAYFTAKCAISKRGVLSVQLDHANSTPLVFIVKEELLDSKKRKIEHKFFFLNEKVLGQKKFTYKVSLLTKYSGKRNYLKVSIVGMRISDNSRSVEEVILEDTIENLTNIKGF